MQAAIPEVDLLWKQIINNDPEKRPVQEFEKKDYARQNRGWLLPGGGGYSYFRTQLQKPLTVLMIVVGLVLLIACANVANLLLARAAGRQREIAIRLAIGAGRARLVSQLVVETLVVSILGGLTGLFFAAWGSRVLIGFMPIRRSSHQYRYVASTCGCSPSRSASPSSPACICGIVPALQATRPDLNSALKNEVVSIGRVRFDLRRILVVSQVAISLLLLIGAGLFIRSLRNLRNLDPGFHRESVLLVDVNPSDLGYKGQRLRDFYDRLLARVQTAHDVRAASLAQITPLAGMRWNSDISVAGYQRKPQEKPYVDFNSVSPGLLSDARHSDVVGPRFSPAGQPACKRRIPSPASAERAGRWVRPRRSPS